jgi:hypothetical protein
LALPPVRWRVQRPLHGGSDRRVRVNERRTVIQCECHAQPAVAFFKVAASQRAGSLMQPQQIQNVVVPGVGEVAAGGEGAAL